MRAKHFIFAALMIASSLVNSGCQLFVPTLTVKEEEQRNSYVAYDATTSYEQALTSLGSLINKHVDYQTLLQIKPIVKVVGSPAIPFDLTEMLTHSINTMHIDPKKLALVEYDPRYAKDNKQTPLKPTLLISGKIVEFDEGLETKEGGFNLDAIFGDGQGETDLGADFGSGTSVSSVALSLHLVNYRTNLIIPSIDTYNRIDVYQLKKTNELGFFIHGSGTGVRGHLKVSQGLHQAVLHLVEYSVLQLLGKYFQQPYWITLGLKEPDEFVLESMRLGFERKSKPQRILEIQKWLRRYPIAPLTIRGKRIDKVDTDGVMGPVTQAFIEEFLRRYTQSVNSEDLTEVYIQLLRNAPQILDI